LSEKGLRDLGKKAKKKSDSSRSLYLKQNKIIHMARMQIGMSLEDCRLLAKEISGKPSISSLSLKQRSDLIQLMEAKGADIFNPRLTEIYQNDKDIYQTRLDYWNNKFPKGRPGFASSKQLALIEVLWESFDDGRAGSAKQGLRGFLWRQTKGLKMGPVCDLRFLRVNQVSAVMTPLREKAKQRFAARFNTHY